MIDLKTWEEDQSRRSSENILKIVDKIDRYIEISPFDLFPELKSLLQDRSWSFSIAMGTIRKKDDPTINYNSLLNCGLYDCIFIPIIPNIQSKDQFEVMYCLNSEKEQKISFLDFLHLIEQGHIIPSFVSPTTSYDRKFYFEILDAYKNRASDLPPLFTTTYDRLMLFLKKVSLACQEGIPEREDWMDRVARKHPEYELTEIDKEIEKMLKRYYGDTVYHRAIRAYDTDSMSLNLQRLRIWNFDERSKIVAQCLEQSPRIGSALLYSFARFFIAPISYGHFGRVNYNVEDVQEMSLSNLSRDLSFPLRDEVLSSSPAASSAVTNRISIEPAVLDADGLFQFLEDHITDRHEIKKKLNSIYDNLRKRDTVGILKDTEALNEIYTEKLNYELARNEKRLGKYFVHFGQTIIAGENNIQGLLNKEITSINNQRLNGLTWLPKTILDSETFRIFTSKSVSRWLNRDWIFNDDALSFVLWRKTE